MSEHALLSPSSAHRWLVCAGSIALESKYPRTSSDAADYGTTCHELAKWSLLVNKKPSDYIGINLGTGLLVTKEMVELVETYLSTLNKYSLFNDLLVEQKIDFSLYTGIPNSFGTSDAIVITSDRKELQIHDLKTGYHTVHATDNPQLMLYALGALYEYGLHGDFEKVKLVIHQSSKNHLDEWNCDLPYLIKFADKVKKQADKIKQALAGDPYQFLTPSEEGCKYCKAAATCPALANKVASTVGAEFEDLSELNSKQLKNYIPTEVDLLATRMAATGMIENWIKAVRAEVERVLLTGAKVPGFKIVQGRAGNRKWLDSDEVIKLFKELKLSKDQIYDMKLISPADAEKLLKIAPEKWERVKKFITQSEGGKSVAPDNDDRAPIDINPVADSFEDLTTSLA